MPEPLPIQRILVADDVASISLFMKTLLTDRRYEVEIAEDGEQCLEKASSFMPALIFLDIMMPKLHGIEVLKRLKSNSKTAAIGVIMCTARRYKSDINQAIELGAFDVLNKPFGKEELLQMVERYFAGEPPMERRKIAFSGDIYLPHIAPGRPYFRLWGTRGSVPVSGPYYARHGGNTSCVELSAGSESIIIDAGTGIRELGQRLVNKGPHKIHIFISHTHWDHIQGFPFFAPVYKPGFELIIYGAPGFKKDLKSIFSGQLDRDYFPVQFEDMRARIDFRPLGADAIQIGDVIVTWAFTHHPGPTVAFKFELGGRSLAYVSDNEFLFGYLGSPHGISLDSEIVDSYRPLVEFLSNVDVYLGEAQYLNDEYQAKTGWGHSSLTNACLLVKLAGVKRWIVIHHDPLHDDEFLGHKLNLTKEILGSLGCPIEVIHASDGLMEYL